MNSILMHLTLLLSIFLFSSALNLECAGPFTFTYNQGHGECKDPVSNIESSMEDSKLLLNLQACPDVAGTETKGLTIIFSAVLFYSKFSAIEMVKTPPILTEF